MKKGKTSISEARSYQEIGEYWDRHDLADHWDRTEGAEFEIDLRSATTYYPVERELSRQLRRIAERRGVSASTLLNLWLQEKTAEETGRG